MHNYIAAKEKALELNISLQHIQYLCRTGKIEGAAKRAGAWFIPNDAPVPLKRRKPNAKGFGFAGAKKAIFESATELFMLKGFDKVSVREIASRAGVRQSTIYSHFKSKQDILGAIYDYYCHYYLADRPDLKDIEPKLKNEIPENIIKFVRYDFKEDYRQKMSDITKIIFQRVAIDDRARQIAKSLMVDDGMEYVEAVFNRGVETGRFAQFNTRAMAVFINSVRVYTLYNWLVAPSAGGAAKLIDDEQALYKYAARLIPDLTLNAQSSGANSK